MKLNCKPGDLAIIVSAKGATPSSLAGAVSLASIGLISRVTHLRPPVNKRHCADALVWEFERPMFVRVGSDSFDILGCSDYDLRPIRDPGDDARDESFRWAPAPEKVLA